MWSTWAGFQGQTLAKICIWLSACCCCYLKIFFDLTQHWPCSTTPHGHQDQKKHKKHSSHHLHAFTGTESSLGSSLGTVPSTCSTALGGARRPTGLVQNTSTSSITACALGLCNSPLHHWLSSGRDAHSCHSHYFVGPGKLCLPPTSVACFIVNVPWQCNI